MVEERLKLENEVQQIFKLIDERRNFLLSGGAGSGKTYSLVQVIRQVLLENTSAKVACMTYTNAAVKEIKERVDHDNLQVSTIHDFLWDNIKHFQKELKLAIINLANDEGQRRINIDTDNPIPDDYFDNLEDGIQYKEYTIIKEGIISHDELLIIAQYLFSNYRKLSDIIKDKYPFIFIDEYQDTNELVIEVFLKHFKELEKWHVSRAFTNTIYSLQKTKIRGLDEDVDYISLCQANVPFEELQITCERLFEKFPVLKNIAEEIFTEIIEASESEASIPKLILDHVRQKHRKPVIGFFGDAMQSIYDDGVGNIDIYKGEDFDEVGEVKKRQNRRNPQKIIDLANRLRTDGIEQVPSDDEDAPNMIEGRVKEGNLMFIYSTNDEISPAKALLSDNHNWDFQNPKITKELNLTHNLIAEKAGFITLLEIYDKDRVIDFRNRIKKYIKENEVDEDFSEYTFGEVVDFLQQGKSGNDLRKVEPTPTQKQFIEENPELYQDSLERNYESFSKLYFDKDQLIDDKKQDVEEENKKGSKRDNLIKHLFKIQHNISLYNNGRYNEFVRLTDYRDKIKSIEDKRVLKRNIESLTDVGEKTIEQIIQEANNTGICLIDDKLEVFKSKKEYLYNRVKEVQFTEFQKLYDYLEGKTPFSTQHKTKGTEFDNVFIVLDNGNWNNYNFENLFLNNGTPSVLERTQKIFYMCCTRAKENLAVFYHNPSNAVLETATEWFGEENLIDIN